MSVKHVLRIAGLGLIAAISGTTASCKETEISEVPVDVARVDLSTASVAVQVGSTATLTATPRSESGQSLTARNVQFSSSNPSVATVSGSGRTAQVTGVSAGSAVITATSGSASNTANVTVTLPDLILNVDNHLLSPVEITVDGVSMGTVPARPMAAAGPMRRTFQIPGASRFTLDWDLVRPVIQGTATELGEPIGGRFEVEVTTQTVFNFTVDNEIAGTTYFAPVITNNTAVGLLMAVNYGLSAENRCNCVVPANSSNIYFGYYELLVDSDIRGYADGSNYTGGYVFWTAAQINTAMVPLTGVTALVSNVTPIPGGATLGSTMAGLTGVVRPPVRPAAGAGSR